MIRFNSSIFVLFLTKCISSETYEPWIPASVNRTDLKCPSNRCNLDPLLTPTTREDCCICHAIPAWQLSGDVQILSLEYTRRGGSASLIGNTTAISRFVHQSGFLSRLPLNICHFINMVQISVQYNRISIIDNITCLQSLDILDLSNNFIKFVGRNTFAGLMKLRILKINHNEVRTLEPFALTGTTMSIFRADLSFNNLTEIDISNVVPENKFCKYDFSSNEITEMVNTGNFALDIEKIYEGGFVNLDSNKFTKFIDFVEFGINDITIFGKVLQFGFSLLDMKWDCDCKMEPFLELAEDVIRRIWRDYFNITCHNPPQYRGWSIPNDFVKSDRLDLLICNVSSAEKCPKRCYCYQQPKKRRTVVNCTAAGLRELPEYIPDYENLTIILKDNFIETFENRYYLNRTLVIDLSNNSLQSVPYETLSNLNKGILLDLSENTLMELPRDFQNFDPCATKMGKIIIPCDCHDFWISDWMKNRKAKECTNISEILCQTERGIVSPIYIKWDDVCEAKTVNLTFLGILFSIIVAVIIGVVSVGYTFRYELYLLNRKYTNRKSHKIIPLLKYDVFFSFNENNEAMRMWSIKILDRYLQNEIAGYKSFVPCRDTLPGDDRTKVLIEKINQCKNYVVVLCDGYQSSDSIWTKIEWKYIWNNFNQNIERKIIVINYDQLEFSQVLDIKLKAFLRLGLDIDFSNRKNNLYQEIKNRLGNSLRKEYAIRQARTIRTRQKFEDQREILTLTEI